MTDNSIKDNINFISKHWEALKTLSLDINKIRENKNKNYKNNKVIVKKDLKNLSSKINYVEDLLMILRVQFRTLNIIFPH